MISLLPLECLHVDKIFIFWALTNGITHDLLDY